MEDLLWKKKSTSRFRYLMLFFIRLAEVLTISIIPSLIGFAILFITPKPRVMQTLEVISLIVFCLMNCVFWVKYVRRRHKRKEFYIMNGIVYLIYIALSVLAYLSSDVYLYTVVFSNVRGFEIFGAGTFDSLIYSHILSIVLMILCGELSYAYYSRMERKAAEDSGEKVEIEEETAIPQKDNKTVTFLDVDEINLQIERDMAEAAEVIKKAAQTGPGSNLGETMSKGKGEKIEKFVPDDPDNDVEDGDYVSEAYARKEMAENMNYDSESLWNEQIYKDNEKILDYDDDDKPEIPDDYDDMWDTESNDGNLFNVECDEYDEMEETVTTDLDGYDSDNLWGNVKQGR